LFTVATWVPASLAPISGLDPSWGAGLSMAFVHHLAWGTNMNFTYGPLGFLSQRVLFFESTAVLATVYLFLVTVATFSLLIHWFRQAFPLPIALLLGYVVGATTAELVDPGDHILVPITLFGLLWVREHDARIQELGVAFLGVLTGTALLGKASDGAVAVVILAIVVACRTGRQRVVDAAIGTAALVGTILAAWLSTGNSLVDIPTFFRNSLSAASGYSSAMQLATTHVRQWWLAVIMILIIAALAALSLRQSPRRVRLPFIVIVLVVTWWALKEGFVRDGNQYIFFGFTLVLMAALPIPSPRVGRLVVAGAVALATAVAWISYGSVPQNIVHVSSDARAFRAETVTIVGSHSRATTIAAARRSMQRGYQISPTQLDELQGHTVAIEPWENGVAWAFPSMTWDPEPILQSYAAYTASLDALDASFLQSDQAPTRILEQIPQGIDARYAFFEPPATWVAMVCRYAQLDASAQWQVLRRVPDRCGSLRPIKQVDATFGQRVAVPVAPPGHAVVARFVRLPLSISYKASSILWKPPLTHLATSAGTFRFIVGTAGDLHLLRPSSTTGYSPPFEPASLDWIALDGAGVKSGSGRYQVLFYDLEVAGGV
jgi:hypothetical protein